MKLLTTALVALALATPVLAAGVSPDAASEAQLRAKLTADGYEVRRVDTEDGMYEVYAMKDGKKYEIYLNDKFEVVKSVED